MHFGSSNSSWIGGGGGTGGPATSTAGVSTVGCDRLFCGGGGATGTLSLETLLDMLCIEEELLILAGAWGVADCSITAR